MNSAFDGSLDNLKQQIEHLAQMSNKIKSIANPAVKQLSVVEEQKPVEQHPQLDSQQAALLKLYDEFIKTDEGKALAANLQRFARYAQSRQNKSE